jgi:hypothetical protein
LSVGGGAVEALYISVIALSRFESVFPFTATPLLCSTALNLFTETVDTASTEATETSFPKHPFHISI